MCNTLCRVYDVYYMPDFVTSDEFEMSHAIQKVQYMVAVRLSRIYNRSLAAPLLSPTCTLQFKVYFFTFIS